MTPTIFFKELGLATLVIALILFGIHQIPALAHLADFSWSCTLMFTIFTIIVYYAGLAAARSVNRQAFTSVSFGFILYKMVISVGFVFVYVKIKEPTSTLFLIPFFIIYFYYTIFETHFMIKLGKMRPKHQPKQ